MMREIFERFRYRFALWRREQREDWLSAGQIDPLQHSRDALHYRDPRNAAIVTESTPRFALRTATVFVGGIAIFALLIYGFTATAWPSGRHVADVVMAVFFGVWSIGIGSTVLDICRARRMHRAPPEK